MATNHYCLGKEHVEACFHDGRCKCLPWRQTRIPSYGWVALSLAMSLPWLIKLFESAVPPRSHQPKYWHWGSWSLAPVDHEIFLIPKKGVLIKSTMYQLQHSTLFYGNLWNNLCNPWTLVITICPDSLKQAAFLGSICDHGSMGNAWDDHTGWCWKYNMIRGQGTRQSYITHQV